MMTQLKICFWLVVFIAPEVIKCTSVVGPRVLRPFGPYRVSVAGGARPQSVYVAVEGRRADGDQFQQGREVQLPPFTSRIIDIDVGDPGPGNYQLVARSTSGPQFSSSAPLVYQARSFCVFIQTDKRVYQPGDTINFRVVALDKYLMPVSGAAEVSVLDARGSAVRQWAAADLLRGVLAADLALADQPALGYWTIQVELRGQKYSRQIFIADYVLPKFQMDIQTPKEVLFRDGRFVVNITAKHFNGLPVRGELTLSSYAVFFSGVLQPVFASPSRKVIDFNGHAEVTYDLKTDLDLAEDAARPLVIEAVLEEKDTLITQNVSSRILLLRTPYRLKVTAPDFFKPDLPYNVQIEVVDPSGRLLPSEGEVSVERLWDDGAPANVTRLTLAKGAATYTLVPDYAHINSTLNLMIKYNEVVERVVNVQSTASAGGQYLTAELLGGGGEVGGELRARVTATEDMDVINYVVIGRGDILHAKTVELSPARRSLDISFSAVPGLAPGAVLVCWYSRLNPAGDHIVASALYIPVKNLLQYEISVEVSGGGRPGSAVELRVRGAAGAHAALLAADSRQHDDGLAGPDGLGSGLDMHTIEREVESFIGLQHSVFNNEEHQPQRGLELGAGGGGEVFTRAGVVILTDGLLGPAAAGSETHSTIETGTRPPLAGPYAFSRLPPPLSPRFYLTQNTQPTWTLANFTIGADDVGSVSRRAPMSGTWRVGAFAVHPTRGLALAAPRTLMSADNLALTAHLPHTLQRSEVLAAVVTLTSALTVDTSVEVTFHNSEQYFEFEPLDNDVDSTKKIELFRRERITVPALGSVSTAFLVVASRAGDAPIIIEASGNGVSASLFKNILIMDGYEEEVETWAVLDGRNGPARANVSAMGPLGARLDAGTVRAAGDLLAPALHRARAPPAPAADPRHAASPMAVGTVLLDYLQATNREEVAIKTEARAQIAAGYQRLMAYRLPDGSFAADIDDEDGDVWMTAVSARWLSRAGRHVRVSPGAAADAARWLTRAQTPRGGWAAPLHPHSPVAQRSLPLTAHALLALLAVTVPASDILFKNSINKAIDFVARGLSDDLDAYSTAVAAAALAAAQHPQASLALEMLDKYVNGTGSSRWWSRPLSGSEWRNPWLRANSAEAATAAWGLRALLAARRVEQGLPVGRFLLNAYGLDADVLESLSELALALKTETKMRITVNITGSEEPKQFNIDDENALIIQTLQARMPHVLALSSGRGVGVLGVSARAHTNATGAWPRYTLDPRVDAVSTKDRLQLSVCVGFVPQGNETMSGFTLLTVQLPSGYLADINTLTELTSSRHVSSAQVSAGGSRVLAWLRPLEPRERCATLAAPRALPVARQRPGYAELIDLYDSSHRARVSFGAVSAYPCDVCRSWSSCARVCGAAAGQRSASPPPSPGTPRSAAAALAAPLVALLVSALILLM